MRNIELGLQVFVRLWYLKNLNLVFPWKLGGCVFLFSFFFINGTWRRIEEPKKRPRLLPRLGHCPSLGRSRGLFSFLLKICKILALGNFSPKLPAWTYWRCLTLKPPYLPDCIFFTNQIIATSIFLVIQGSFFMCFYSFEIFSCFWILKSFSRATTNIPTPLRYTITLQNYDFFGEPKFFFLFFFFVVRNPKVKFWKEK